MGGSGKQLRLSRIFNSDGKSLIVPIDHGLAFGPLAGLEDPGEKIKEFVKGGADAFMMTYGIAKKYHNNLSGKGVIVRIDGGPTEKGNDIEATDIMYTVEDLIRIGADAVITSIWLGGIHETRTILSATRLAGICDYWGMPLFIETFMSSGVEVNAENVAMAARVASDLGADVIKTYLVGDVDEYRKVISSSFCPVIILGGEKSNDKDLVLKWVKTAIDSGAKGSCIGRNVFQHSNPEGVVKALHKVIHEGETIEKVRHMIA